MTRERGRLEVIAGCMFSRKSLELFIRIDKAMIARQKVLVFKPSIDKRFSENSVKSRTGVEVNAICVDSNNPHEILDHTYLDADLVAIDEVQFFEEAGIEKVIDELIDMGINVVVSGLDTDFRGEPFGAMGSLLAKADEKVGMKAICSQCFEEATRTQRLINGEPAPHNSPLILVGDTEFYEPRCRDCHIVPK